MVSGISFLNILGRGKLGLAENLLYYIHSSYSLLLSLPTPFCLLYPVLNFLSSFSTEAPKLRRQSSIMLVMWLLHVLAAQSALAFPFMGNVPVMDSSLLARGYVHNDKRQNSYLVNPTRAAAAPYGIFTYSGVINGFLGTGIGGYKVL